MRAKSSVDQGANAGTWNYASDDARTHSRESRNLFLRLFKQYITFCILGVAESAKARDGKAIACMHHGHQALDGRVRIRQTGSNE
jgi:hypothetical protein